MQEGSRRVPVRIARSRGRQPIREDHLQGTNTGTEEGVAEHKYQLERPNAVGREVRQGRELQAGHRCVKERGCISARCLTGCVYAAAPTPAGATLIEITTNNAGAQTRFLP